VGGAYFLFLDYMQFCCNFHIFFIPFLSFSIFLLVLLLPQAFQNSPHLLRVVDRDLHVHEAHLVQHVESLDQSPVGVECFECGTEA